MHFITIERGEGVNSVILELPQHTNLQTETGGHVMTPLPGCTPTKPGSACFPFFGVVAVILDEAGKVIMKKIFRFLNQFFFEGKKNVA